MKKELEDRITYILSEWFNDAAPLGQEAYRRPAQSVIREVLAHVKKKKVRMKPKPRCGKDAG